MSKAAFRTHLALLIGLILFSISPFAGLGGMLIAIGLFAPYMFTLAAMGVEVNGQTTDGILLTSFIALCVFLGLIAGWFFLRGYRKSGDAVADEARASFAIALSLLTVPVVLYLCFTALPGM